MAKIEERRKCKRFEVPGTTASIEKKKFFIFGRGASGESTPVLNISRGGLLFLSQEIPVIDQRLVVHIYFPNEKKPMKMKARVRWTDRNPGISYDYMIGIQFDSYGRKKRNNPVSNLEKLIRLEKKITRS
jgi:hypothetical protein